MNTTRRQFLSTSCLALGALSVPGLANAFSPMAVKSLGFQTWTLREEFNADPAGSCRRMADLGYKELEMCSPLGYKGAGFAPLGEYSGKELQALFNDNGLTCTSSHFTMGELREHLDDRISWAQDMGISQMILSTFWLPKEEQTIDNYKKASEELNLMAEKTKAAGIQMGFHNHHWEFEKRDGTLIYDVLLETLDPDLVKMQFQVAVVDIGYNAADYFRKYPGRFISAHLADWSKAKEDQVPIGQGEVNWKDFFKAAKVGGVKNIYVEMSPEKFASSANYLASL